MAIIYYNSCAKCKPTASLSCQKLLGKVSHHKVSYTMHFAKTSFFIGATLGKRQIPYIPSLRKQFNIIAVYLGVSLKFLKAAAYIRYLSPKVQLNFNSELLYLAPTPSYLEEAALVMRCRSALMIEDNHATAKDWLCHPEMTKAELSQTRMLLRIS